MAVNKQILLLLLPILFLVTASNCRTLMSRDKEDGSYEAGIDAFAQSLGYLPKGDPVPPSGPSRRRNWEQLVEKAVAEVAAGGKGGEIV
ncbi:hypothetical protein QQ045_008494 [Rhodiola kirilowii]